MDGRCHRSLYTFPSLHFIIDRMRWWRVFFFFSFTFSFVNCKMPHHWNIVAWRMSCMYLLTRIHKSYRKFTIRMQKCPFYSGGQRRKRGETSVENKFNEFRLFVSCICHFGVLQLKIYRVVYRERKGERYGPHTHIKQPHCNRYHRNIKSKGNMLLHTHTHYHSIWTPMVGRSQMVECYYKMDIIGSQTEKCECEPL